MGSDQRDLVLDRDPPFHTVSETVIWINAALLAAAAVTALALPAPSARPDRPGPTVPEPSVTRHLLAQLDFRQLLLVTGLVQGSYALHGAFATLRWQAAGIEPEMIGALWAVAVASEVAVFLLIGPWLLARLGAARLVMAVLYASAVPLALRLDCVKERPVTSPVLPVQEAPSAA
jgi:PPP family 3-phenylpropionic acid transporter